MHYSFQGMLAARLLHHTPFKIDRYLVFLLLLFPIIITLTGCYEVDALKIVESSNFVGIIERMDCSNPLACHYSLIKDSTFSTEIIHGPSDSIHLYFNDNSLPLDSNGIYEESRLRISLKDDTLKIYWRIGGNVSWYSDSYIGVKNQTSPLRAGTVGFFADTIEVKENTGLVHIPLKIEGAKFGGAFDIYIAESSTAVNKVDYYYSHFNSVDEYLGPDVPVFKPYFFQPNALLVNLQLSVYDDSIPEPSKTIVFRISDKSVGAIPYGIKELTFIILDDD